MAGIKKSKVMGIQTRLRKFRDAFGEEFVERVKERTPVDSGTLQAGWEHRMKEQDVEITNKVPYASFVEQGTEKMAGAHMLATTSAESEEIAKVAAERVGLKVR